MRLISGTLRSGSEQELSKLFICTILLKLTFLQKISKIISKGMYKVFKTLETKSRLLKKWGVLFFCKFEYWNMICLI
jgi:hypothetical protein